VPVPTGIGDAVRVLEGCRRVGVLVRLHRADVDERVGPDGVLPQPAGHLLGPPPPPEGLLDVVAEHGELRQGAAGARQLARLAERLQHLDRRARLGTGGCAVTRVPTHPRADEPAPPVRRVVAGVPVRVHRPVESRQRVGRPSHEVGDRAEVLEQPRPL
jgi:hypothetical protein